MTRKKTSRARQRVLLCPLTFEVDRRNEDCSECGAPVRRRRSALKSPRPICCRCLLGSIFVEGAHT